ncbi:CAP domain-containing protein [Thiorhodovibrio frisius]|uniref:Uncharacterized protein with SCP/PR1 domains n=1 Tax=Thiorhodovibrio frisius TaxID=631362 RepID=H8YWY2_9GAMM|nr:CAP domain-containing protein [Thiorhodovibrio frisius]EIC22958.1 uncharacterized protein with SCP/PR1 domains [Thiorhodovibrio frisius]WPL22780.1 hypothetical protein Thiofri_02952 [Thiorhodovibrio frisius]
MASPSDFEQLMLELVNRARADPNAEAAGYGIDLNADLAPGSISPQAKQPLVMNTWLMDSARGHSAWMLENNIFSHTGEGGSSAGDRIAAAGYDFVAPSTWGENISWRGTTSPMPLDLEEYVHEQHKGLFLSKGHRLNIMGESFREIGIGQVSGVFTEQGADYNASMITENFAASGDYAFLGGVVYEDLDNDDFYSPGEGIGGVKVSVDGLTTTTTWESGGYQVALAPGSYTVTFSGGTLDSPVTRALTIGQENEKIDLIVDEFLQPPEPPPPDTDPLPIPNLEAYYTLIDATPNQFFVAEGLEAGMLGKTAGKTINVAEGAAALGLAAGTSVNIEGDSADYRLQRNDTMLEVVDFDGTIIASISGSPTQTSTLRFSDGAATFAIENNHLAIGGQILVADGDIVGGTTLELDDTDTAATIFTDAGGLPGNANANAFLILTDKAPERFTLGEGLVVELLGGTGGTTINIPDGAGAARVSPNTTLNFEGPSNDFTFTRHGTTMDIRDDEGNLAAMLVAATGATTTLIFADGFVELGVANQQLSLGGVIFTEGQNASGADLTVDLFA